MSLGRYLREHAAEMVLFAIMAAALSATMAECFFIDSASPATVGLLLGCVVVLTCACYAAASSRKAVLIGIPAIVGAVVVAYIVLSFATPVQLFEDSYSNPVFMFHVAVLITLLLFLCTRRTPLFIAAFIIGAFLCSAVQFLYSQNHVLEAVAYLAAGAAIVMLRRGIAGDGAVLSGVAKRLGAPLAALAVALVALGAACLVFFLVIAPLNPPARELKLITERYALEEVHVSGLTDILHTPDKNQDSRNRDDETKKTNQTDGSTDDAQGQGSPEPNGDDQSLGGGMSALGDVLSRALKYLQDNWIAVVLVFLLVLVVAYVLCVLLRRWLRKRALGRLGALGPAGEAAGIYRYVCRGYELCGVYSRGSATPSELAANNQAATTAFENGAMPVDFRELTCTFERVVYGGQVPQEAELEQLRGYYRGFPACALRHAGRFKYIRLFFKL